MQEKASERTELPLIRDTKAMFLLLKEIEAIENRKRVLDKSLEDAFKDALKKVGQQTEGARTVLRVSAGGSKSREPVENALKTAFEQKISADALIPGLANAGVQLSEEEMQYAQALWLFKEEWPAEVVSDGQKLAENFRALERRIVEKSAAIYISRDEHGKPFGAAVLAPMEKTQAILVTDLVAAEGKERGMESRMLLIRALDEIKERARRGSGFEPDFIVAEARMPSGELSAEENKRRIEHLALLSENGIYPVSDFNYARPLAIKGRPEPMLLCAKPLTKKQIEPSQLEAAVREMHEYYGVRVKVGPELKHLYESVGVRLTLLNVKKLMKLEKLFTPKPFETIQARPERAIPPEIARLAEKLGSSGPQALKKALKPPRQIQILPAEPIAEPKSASLAHTRKPVKRREEPRLERAEIEKLMRLIQKEDERRKVGTVTSRELDDLRKRLFGSKQTFKDDDDDDSNS